VVVPTDASGFKREAIARYGATVVDCAPGQANREAKLAELVDKCGATVVHPYDNSAVIAGQGTAALELLEQAGPLDLLLTPVGGGGLVSGCALAAHEVCPGIVWLRRSRQAPTTAGSPCRRAIACGSSRSRPSPTDCAPRSASATGR
jgi:threonine dehydratase